MAKPSAQLLDEAPERDDGYVSRAEVLECLRIAADEWPRHPKVQAMSPTSVVLDTARRLIRKLDDKS